MFEASQFDSYSYLFNKPAFISLDDAVDPDQIRIQGVRIGINGAEAQGRPGLCAARPHGHGRRLRAGDRLRPVADIGTVVALDKGPAADEFFLSFERIGANTHPFTRAGADAAAAAAGRRPGRRRSACAPSRRSRPRCRR